MSSLYVPGLMRMTTGLSGLPAAPAMTASCTDLYFALPSAATTSSTGAADAPRAPTARQDRRHTAKHVAVSTGWFVLFISILYLSQVRRKRRKGFIHEATRNDTKRHEVLRALFFVRTFFFVSFRVASWITFPVPPPAFSACAGLVSRRAAACSSCRRP